MMPAPGARHTIHQRPVRDRHYRHCRAANEADLARLYRARSQQTALRIAAAQPDDCRQREPEMAGSLGADGAKRGA